MQPEAATRWLGLAEGDLLVAAKIVADDELPASAAAFHAQQAAEKALKGVLAASGVAFERIHDLEALLTRVPEPARGRFDEGELALLTPWAVQGRYGIDDVGFGREDVRALVEAAERVVSAAREVVSGL